MKKQRAMFNCGSLISSQYCEFLCPDNCHICPGWSPKKPSTKGDRVRSMTNEELAVWICSVETDGRAYGPMGIAAWSALLEEEDDINGEEKP